MTTENDILGKLFAFMKKHNVGLWDTIDGDGTHVIIDGNDVYAGFLDNQKWIPETGPEHELFDKMEVLEMVFEVRFGHKVHVRMEPIETGEKYFALELGQWIFTLSPNFQDSLRELVSPDSIDLSRAVANHVTESAA